MKAFLLVLAMTVVPCMSHGATSHFIATNVYVIDQGAMYQLYETEHMSKKFFELCASSQGDAFAPFENQFEQINSIAIYVPNNPFKTQTVVLNFVGRKKQKKIKTNFFSFTADPKTDRRYTKIFDDNYLAVLNERFGAFYSHENVYNTENTKLVSSDR